MVEKNHRFEHIHDQNFFFFDLLIGLFGLIGVIVFGAKCVWKVDLSY